VALLQGKVGWKAFAALLLSWPQTLRGPAGSQRGVAACERDLVTVPSPAGSNARVNCFVFLEATKLWEVL